MSGKGGKEDSSDEIRSGAMPSGLHGGRSVLVARHVQVVLYHRLVMGNSDWAPSMCQGCYSV
jgi:hypothetical protein